MGILPSPQPHKGKEILASDEARVISYMTHITDQSEKLAIGECPMGVTANTIDVAHPLEVKNQEKVAAVIGYRDVESLDGRRINVIEYPEPWPNL